MKRAGCYIRVSTDDQAEFSPPSQLREMKDYAAKNGMKIIEKHIYVDEGISGRSSDRPAFLRMINAAGAEEKPFDVLLLYKFSRFARNREDSVVYKSILRKKCGIEVISIKEPIDAENKMSIIMEAFIEAMDEYYSVNLSEDVRRTMTEKAMKGQYQSSPPFGYNMKDGRLVIDEYESAVVRDIYEKIINGAGYSTVARWLNESGVKTKRGGRFESRAVEYIIHNPVYCGLVRWNPQEHTNRNYGSCGLILTEGEHEAVVNRETWQRGNEAVKRKASSKKINPGDARAKDWLSGMVKCASCGSSLVKSGAYWRCSGYAKAICKASQHIPDKLLKKLLISRLCEDLGHTGNIIAERSEAKSKADLHKAMLHKNQLRFQRAREAYLSGVDGIEIYEQTKKRLIKEKESIIKNMQRETKSPVPQIISIPDILESVDINNETKAKIIQCTVSKIVLDKKENEISIYYQ